MKKVLLLVLAICFSVPALADRLRFLARGEEALAARLDLIQSASDSIRLTYYIFEPCHESTGLILQALNAAAKRGVRVQMLLDAYTLSEENRANLALWTRKRKIEFKLFNAGWNKNFRSHIKFIVADGRRYISGGRNVGDDYFGLSHHENYVDADVDVTGASATQVEKDFDGLWNGTYASQASEKKADLAKFQAQCLKSEAHLGKLSAHFRAKPKILSSLPVRTCRRLSFTSDSPFFQDVPDHSRGLETHEEYMHAIRLHYKKATSAFLKFLMGTKKSLILQNWGYIPNLGVELQFELLRSRKAHILVLTNHEAGTGGAFDKAFDLVSRYYIRRDHDRENHQVMDLRANGALSDAWAFTPAGTKWRIHSKTGVSDGRHAFVSSHNIDPRSYMINLESAVTVQDCPELAADVMAQMSKTIKAYMKDEKRFGKTEDHSSGFWDRVLAFWAHNLL